ncbi:hypothetical protein EON64_00990 [archaeon]|nr:MAG: hypothetical protein EON64_00990 [archaeon]
MSRAEQESYVLCLSTTVRLLQAVAAHCGRGDPLHASHNIAQNLVVKVCLLRTSTSQAPARSRGLQQTHLYNQILCNIMASVKRVTTHAVSFAHQMSDTSSSASAEEAFTRSVQLHAISLTRYVTATAALEEVEIELSDLLQHLLVRVLLDENCHVECRLSLMQTLQDMLGSPGHCALLDKFCHSLFTQTCFSDRWHEGVKGEVANQPGTLLQVYVRIAKVIASPDSFGRSALLSYCLKAVHTILHLDGPLGAEIQPLSNWVWLQRYLYDHRSAFKSFALQIFTRVVQSSAMTDDNTLVPSFAHQLLEGVYHIVIDQHESRVVRAHAMHLAILLYFPADGTRLSQSDECALSLPHLVDAIGELLGRSNDSKLAKSGLASVALATSDELLLITRVLCLLWRNSEAQRLVHSNRIVPLLIELLNPLYCQMGAKQRQAMLGIETGKKQDGGDYCPNYLERLLTKQKEGHFVSATHIYTFLLQLCDDQPQWIEDSARFGSLIAHVSADIVSLNSEENKGVTEEMFLCRLVAVFSLLYRLHHLSHCNEQCVQKAPGSLYNDSLMLLNRAVIVLRDSSEAGLRSAGGLHRQVLQVGGRWAAYLLQAAGENQPRKIERDTLSHLVERLLSYRLNIFKQIVMTGSNVGMLTEYGETELEIAAAQVDVLIALTLHSHPASLYQLTTVLLNPPHAALLQYFLQTVKDCARYGEQKVGPLQVTSLSVSSVTTPGRFRGNNRVSPGSTASLRATSKW